MDSKECTKCGEVKSLDEFYKQKKQKDGLTHQCKSCSKAYAAKYRKDNIEAYKEKDKLRYEQNKDYYAQKNKRWHQNNADRKLEYNREWHLANPGKRSAYQNKRYISQKQRTVSWANEQLIAAYYKEAKRLEELTGIKFHVDHIIPLQGELVSGLHVETNLQLLPAHENLGKSNSFDPELFCA